MIKRHDTNETNKFENPSNRRNFLKKAPIGGLGVGLLSANIASDEEAATQTKTMQKGGIRIMNLNSSLHFSPIVL